MTGGLDIAWKPAESPNLVRTVDTFKTMGWNLADENTHDCRHRISLEGPRKRAFGPTLGTTGWGGIWASTGNAGEALTQHALDGC